MLACDTGCRCPIPYTPNPGVLACDMRALAQVLVPGRQNLSLVFAWALDHDPLKAIARALPDPDSNSRTGFTADSEAGAGSDAEAAFDAAEVLAAADRLTHPNRGGSPRTNGS